MMLLIDNFVTGATGLQHLKINGPSIVRAGDAVSLSCLYDLEGPLYTIKWYLDDEEFYRYVPKAMPPQNSYPVQGIKVDVSSATFFFFHVLSV